MAHNNRGRLAVDLGGNWRLYTNTLPVHSRAIGTVTRDGYDTGALVLIETTGLYVQINAGAIKHLPQHEIKAVIDAVRTGRGGPGRGQGRRANDGAIYLRRRSVSLDDETVASLRKLGGGDLSLGIRRAAKLIGCQEQIHTKEP